MALSLGLVLLGGACSSPTYRYVAHSSTKTYLKVPRAWKGYDANLLDQAEARALENAGEPGPSFVDLAFTGAIQWRMAFDGDPNPQPAHAVSFSAAPVAEVRVRQLTDDERDRVNLASLRNMFFPYDELKAQADQEQLGRPLQANPPPTGAFQALGDKQLNLADGVRGNRLRFELRQGDEFFVIDQTAMLDGATKRVYVLLIRASESQYIQHQKQLNEIASSFTVKQKG
ncbi:MAG: hypothetical protein ACR2HY_10490 [Acidimicrobiales bacterium]